MTKDLRIRNSKCLMIVQILLTININAFFYQPQPQHFTKVKQQNSMPLNISHMQ